MPTSPAPSPTDTITVTVTLDDFHSLACRGLSIPLAARLTLTAIDADGGLGYRLTPDATPAEVNAELAVLLRSVLADILGPRGLYVDVDVTAGTGVVYLTPLGGIPQRAATITITPAHAAVAA